MPDKALKSHRQASLELGKLAEDLVAQWLIAQGWEILQQRWRCQWGELDLVIYTANPASTQTPLAFVEVKARSSGNWDTNGLLSITSQKRDKLWRSAQFFLTQHPHLAALPCRFDVALVSCRLISGQESRSPLLKKTSVDIEIGKAVTIDRHCLTLQQYIPGAFD
ncbi:MAG: YraN family protein [Drouetiella hepatica Uher 2000/2452]|jgi:putative endonuclease|uniref:UPF0102 protein KME15_02730 n=1 Tax=Drouetiella hepatica Uher 2000/2452 TaxID=904376 RepID=A0A951Q7Z9_9CYAN|nr:YraN family protein [Drouetiella hepatica Uher 2000/2452]